MRTSDAIRNIQKDVGDAKANGLTKIEIDKLEEYLARSLDVAIAHESGNPDSAKEADRGFEVWKVNESHRTQMSVEMFKSILEAGQTALKALMLMNGGAAAALLAFCGNAITKGQSLSGDPLLTAAGAGLACFVAGMGCAGLATGIRYLAQFSYGNSLYLQTSPWKTAGNWLNAASVAIALAGFVAFCWGGVATYSAIASPAHVAAPVQSQPTPLGPA